ncbi:Tn7-like element transposition protein TnsE [Psychrobacillus sp. FSL H8-0484]|uniref:Tn7-like element transposition protein TnsE n=1 Tax=Psychrobacillus sp. FSL H8-0484 TaxID=2921390 RepID=UPI0030F6D008
MEQYPQVKAIRVFIDELTEGLGERKFTKLSDGITKRRYVIAEVFLALGERFSIIEVERETKSLSTLMLFSSTIRIWEPIYEKLLENLVNDSGTWASKSLEMFEYQGIIIKKSKHNSKSIYAKAQVLYEKWIKF